MVLPVGLGLSSLAQTSLTIRQALRKVSLCGDRALGLEIADPWGLGDWMTLLQAAKGTAVHPAGRVRRRLVTSQALLIPVGLLSEKRAQLHSVC